MKDPKQGVRSQIDFPLGQDEMAISRAIVDLLTEGWSFIFLTKTHITLGRSWEYGLTEERRMEEIQHKELKPKK